MEKPKKKVIGRIEKVDFPELKLFNIDSKIDTGAYTSSLHCHLIIKKEYNNISVVRFRILDPSHPGYQEIEFQLPIYDERKVRNSMGESEHRIFIKTPLLLFNEIFEIELSLTDRSKMKYPFLLGRKALRGRFLVDVSQINLSYKLKMRGIL